MGTHTLHLLVLAVVSCLASPTLANVHMITSPAELPPAGRIDWGQLGPATRYGDNNHPSFWGTLISTPFNTVSTIGVGATITAAGTQTDPLLRADAYDLPSASGEPIYAPGNFDEGDRLLYARWHGDGHDIRKPLTFTFSTPIRGFGAQGQADIFGGYALQLEAYDAANHPLISRDVGGSIVHYFENYGSFGMPMLGSTAAFLGVVSDSANIAKIVFTVNGGTGEMLLDSPYLSNIRDGDANLDGQVNSIDFDISLGHYGSSGNTWSTGDFDRDTKVTTADFNLLAGNFGEASPAVPGAVVPEPCLGVCLMGMVALRRKTRGTVKMLGRKQ